MSEAPPPTSAPEAEAPPSAAPVESRLRRRRSVRRAALRAKAKQRRLIALAGAAGVALLIVLVASAAWLSHRRPPQGHVVARIGARELTLEDLEAEARGQGVVYDAATAPELLRTVVSRTLLAQAARARKLDRDAAFPGDKVRVQDELLAGRAVRALVRGGGQPDGAAVERLIAARPTAFAERRTLKLRQVRLILAKPAAYQTLAALPTLEALKAELLRLHIPFAEAEAVADTATLPEGLTRALLALEPGRALTTQQGAAVVASEVLDTTPVSASAAEQRALARQLLARQAGVQALDGVVAELERRARIVYQPGFRPAPATQAVTQPPDEPR